eukprot:GHVN01048373.1.p3 GENE.GHVN01048373.1~~GHVN01048373.1.p3  ORF type:complete len:101 (+),score=7.00 GHVN01048373.1:4000-4302(+)
MTMMRERDASPTWSSESSLIEGLLVSFVAMAGSPFFALEELWVFIFDFFCGATKRCATPFCFCFFSLLKAAISFSKKHRRLLLIDVKLLDCFRKNFPEVI